MQVRCNANRGRDLPRKYLSLGYTEHSVFNVNVGSVYTVLCRLAAYGVPGMASEASQKYIS